MSELVINKSRACAVTGHRLLKRDFDKKRLKEVFVKLIDAGYDTFLVGMAVGFDTECFLALESLRKKNNIKIIACIPCESQPIRFSERDRKKYYEMISSADEKVLISKEYTAYCMMKRNMFMVNNCSVLVCYLREEKGGTKNTVEYAKKQGVSIIEV